MWRFFSTTNGSSFANRVNLTSLTSFRNFTSFTNQMYSQPYRVVQGNKVYWMQTFPLTLPVPRTVEYFKKKDEQVSTNDLIARVEINLSDATSEPIELLAGKMGDKTTKVVHGFTNMQFK